SFFFFFTRTLNDRRVYRLPSEWEWECAVRWGDRYNDVYWWGSEYRLFEKHKVWIGGKTKTRSYRASQQAAAEDEDGHVSGMLDPVGNVWCWCGNRYSASGSSGVLRGSSFRGLDVRDFARAAYRVNYTPVNRYYYGGMRLVYCERVVCPSSTASG
ncbi:MAG: SUMF1/EgtB/PvdO family nonheme iron enzyme, partial [Planctomycetaceae bacterium]|nr:SUMF1/EgtB/PvdO family nonheme iron enzyme [Planctomycetaceae bacterium]